MQVDFYQLGGAAPEQVIASLAEKGVDALNVVPDTLFGSYRENLIAVLTRYAMPAMFALKL